MTHDSALAILKIHQIWRRGLAPYDVVGIKPSYTPAELSQAIDIAIKIMEAQNDRN